MVNRKTMLLFFGIILIIVLVSLFIWLILQGEEQTSELNKVEVIPVENAKESGFREIVNKTVRDLDLSLTQECEVSTGSFACKGIANENNFEISFTKKDYGDWVNSWNILLNKTNKQENERISRDTLLGFSTYSHYLTQGAKQFRETTSVFSDGYSFYAVIQGDIPEKAERISSKEVIEKLINNLKKYE